MFLVICGLLKKATKDVTQTFHSTILFLFGRTIHKLVNYLLIRCSDTFFYLNLQVTFLESNMSNLDVIQGTYAAFGEGDMKQ
jgi:hypothetical protein